MNAFAAKDQLSEGQGLRRPHWPPGHYIAPVDGVFQYHSPDGETALEIDLRDVMALDYEIVAV